MVRIKRYWASWLMEVKMDNESRLVKYIDFIYAILVTCSAVMAICMVGLLFIMLLKT